MKKKIALITMSVLLLFTLAACSKADVVGSTSIDSFSKVLNAIPNSIAADENEWWLGFNST